MGELVPEKMVGERIETEDQARNWIAELVVDMKYWRAECDVTFPSAPEKTAKYQRRACWTFLVKQGKVVGALQALLLTGKINECCYAELNQQAINTLAPTVVGHARG
jgi:hypothetical protein